jgi:putative PIG3 family NAD(P)H quinone oxidoreductase
LNQKKILEVNIMKAVVLDGFGDSEVMHIGEAQTPVPDNGQVRVKVSATSVNRADIIQRQGHYPSPPGESEILGLEVAGVIDALGPGVDGWKPGDRVMSLVAGGGYGQYALAYAGHLMPIPESMSFAEAACVSETYITAFLNIFLIGDFKSNETVLIHGGGGGVNTSAIQLCRALVQDATIAVTASPGKIDRVKALGADLVINYRRQNFAEEVRAFTGQKGADVILDHIGADYLQSNLKCLAVEGRLVVIGVISGAVAELNLAHMMVKRQRIIGSVIRARPVEEKGRITAAFKERVLPLFADRSIVPLIHRQFPLENVRAAHQEMEESRHFGKIVLQVDDMT